ncbi:hypothetical protein JVU11DRAFT_3751 [Chiua virens]|nr:hypothetical protein JVU11DRAFT_3751 [Chiua virens]
MVDPSIKPRHISQLQPIFVDHIASVHERAKQKCQRNQESLLEKKQMRECVLAFSFPRNDEDPVTVDFQDGFIYPYFKLTCLVLAELELILPEDKVVSPVVPFFDPSLNTWIKMKVDSVIELTKPSQKFFFKGVNITSYPRFNHHFSSASACEANLCVLLSQECTYVKQTQTNMKAHVVGALDALLELLSDEDFDNLSSAPPSRKHHTQSQSNQLFQHSRKPRCDSNFSHDDDVISLHDDNSITDAKPDQTTKARCVPDLDVTQAKFPSSFYAVNVHTAFTFRATGDLMLEAQFMHFFDLPWKSSTYYYHKAQWFNAPHDARDNVVAASYSDTGHYSTF